MKVETANKIDIQTIQPPRNKDGPAAPEQIKPKELEKISGKKLNLNELLRKEINQSSSNVNDQRQAKEIPAEKLEQVIEEANETLEKYQNKHLSFFIDEESGKQGVRIIDVKTKEVIKQIPPEEMVELAARLKERIGAIIDEII